MLEGALLEWAWLMGAMFFGISLGCMTGLIPGLHVNTLALILLSLSPIAVAVGIPLNAVAAVIVATGIVHTFLNYIPGALIGAPDGDTALSLLPGHRMLLSGLAARGVAWSARGSQMGLLLSLPLLVVARILLGPEIYGCDPDDFDCTGYGMLRNILPYLMLFIWLILLVTETTRLPWPRVIQKLTRGRLGDNSNVAGVLAALSFSLLTGFFGWAIFRLPAHSPVGLPSTLLMPALAGLFGIANLYDIYRTQSSLPDQKVEWNLPPAKPLVGPISLSSIAGGLMGVMPGMTAAQATVLVMSGRNLVSRIRGEEDRYADFESMGAPTEEEEWLEEEGGLNFGSVDSSDDDDMILGVSPDLQTADQGSESDLEVIAVLSSVNTAVTVMVLGFLYMIGRPRSGAALALNMMYPIDRWVDIQPPADFIRLLAVTVASGMIAVPIMLYAGRGVLKLHALLPLRTMVLSVVIFIALITWLSTGWIGLFILFAATFIGLLPPRIGIRRSHAMGIILIPVMIYQFSYRFGWM